MKKLLFGIVGLFFIAACNNNPKGDKATTTDEVADTASVNGDTYTVDPASSSIIWTGRKVTGSHHGTIAVQSGSVVLNNNQLSGGEFIIDMNSLEDKDMEGDAENKGKLEGHLKSDDFFATDKYPTSKFVVTKVDQKADNKVDISGNLTMKDITKNITFTADIKQNTAEKFVASADFNINRKDWGVVYTGMQDDLIADEINFKVNLTANK